MRSTETNISKTSSFHDDKRIWPIFLRNVEFDKAPRLVNEGPEAFVTNIMPVIGEFFGDLRGQ